MKKIKFIGNKMRILDYFEQAILLVLYIWFVLRLLPGSLEDLNPYLGVLILSESIVIFLIIIRKPTGKISHNFRDWVIAFSGTLFPLLVSTGGEPLMPRVGVALLISGLIIHVGAKISLFRSFGIVAAERGVKVNGLYTIIRHPMYAGYFISHIGFLMAAPSLWNFTVYIFCWGFLLSRIFAEERMLMRSSDYQEYKNRVFYRIIPGVF